MFRGEQGQALPLVLIVVALGTLVITPFLSHAGVSMAGSQVFGTAIEEQYACDSGVEHAVWNLAEGGLAPQIIAPGDSAGYNLSESINKTVPGVRVSNSWETIASDDFESGGWSGGSGWLADWSYQGDAGVVTTGAPEQGVYHLRLRSNDGYAKRSVDVRGPSATLQFWAKANSFETGDTAQCLVSPNGIDWTVERTWVVGDDDNIYRLFSFDLSSFTSSSQFWVAFKANMSGTGDYFYVDDLKVLWIVDTTAPIASDNFESGGWSGGAGWLADWTYAGDAAVVTTGAPYQGTYHLRLSSDTGYVSRPVDLSTKTVAILQFQAKADSFETGETAQCLVSENGTGWTTVHTWVDGDDDNIYHFFSIDLSSFNLTSDFWIAFQANMSGTGDFLYVDDLVIKGPTRYAVSSRAGNSVIKAIVEIAGGAPSILQWWVR